MTCDKCYSEIILHKNHQRFVSLAYTLFYVLGMSRKMECVRLYGMLVYRSCNQNVYSAFTIIGQSSFQSVKSSLSGLCSRLAKFHLKFFCSTVKKIQSSVLYLPCRVNNTEVGRNIHRLAMVGRDLWRTVHHRCTQLHHFRFGKSFQYNLIAYSVNVTVGDSHSYFSSFHVNTYIYCNV